MVIKSKGELEYAKKVELEMEVGNGGIGRFKPGPGLKLNPGLNPAPTYSYHYECWACQNSPCYLIDHQPQKTHDDPIMFYCPASGEPINTWVLQHKRRHPQ